MAAPLRTPRSTWIEHGLRALADGGPRGVRVDALARALGVTRGGFYHHFASRSAFLDALLDAWEQQVADDVIERVEREGGDPGTRARRAGALTFAPDVLPVDLAIRDWARRDPAVAARLRRVDDRRMGYLRTQFAAVTADPGDVEARCLLAFATAIGHHFVAAGHDGRSREEVLARAASWLFRSGA